MTDWASRRSRFNHDRLKNEFTPAVNRLVRIFERKVSDEAFVTDFFQILGSRWDILQAEATQLCDEASYQIGVQAWFDAYPLSLLPPVEKAWMSELLDRELQLSQAVHRKVAQVRQHLAQTDYSVRGLIKAFEHHRIGWNSTENQGVENLLERTRQLALCCSTLSQVFSLLAPENPLDLLAASNEQLRVSTSQ